MEESFDNKPSVLMFNGHVNSISFKSIMIV